MVEIGGGTISFLRRKDVERCLAAGMDGPSSKPLDTAKRTAAVSRYIRAGRARA
ncbi:hypothetical protein [Pseudoflavonifractor sp. MSJ-37]|uniref:hypothetical protein n=1 Tax=Pseudoflavonifractor sp. MSJ-37 TaxID=2841531 RepID=UPI001C11844B|nr:hypothetical protein [Pseudoflavonifractor sp. MSJ-37]MBU5436207.1 hypothetical protein [Pseudoflavonifractor sp. MSJ-37]